MKKNIIYVILVFLSVFALFLDVSMFENMEDLDYSQFYNMNVLFMGVVAVLLFVVLKRTNKIKLGALTNCLAMFFSIFMLIGEAYVSSGTFQVMFSNILTLLATIFKVISYFVIFRIGFSYLYKWLFSFRGKKYKIKNKKLLWYLDLFKKRPFLTSLITILIGWSIYLIAFYPVVLSPDPSFQIRQYFNVPTKYIDWVIQVDPSVNMTAHHPVLHTYLLGFAIDIGRWILNDNFGLFLYTLLQTAVYSSVLAYSIKFARNNGIGTKWCMLLLAIYIFVPMFPFYTVAAVKDTYYTAFMILYVLFIFDIVKNYREKPISIKYMLYIFVVMLLLSLFRNNGLYVILLSFPILLFYTRKNLFKLLCAFVLFYGSLTAFNDVLIPYLGISPGSVREVLSIPFQQTARYVKYHSDELSEHDIEVIDNILGYDTLASRYDPEKSDDVKNEYNKYTTDDELKEYFKVWFDGLTKHPETYVDATLNNVYGYFYPNSHKWYLYSEFDDRVTQNDLVDYSYNGLSWLRDILTAFGNIFPYIPVIGLISSIGANTWVVLILLVLVIERKKARYVISILPLLASILICVASPVNTYFRYTMPYIFVLPVLSMLLLKVLRGDKYEKK